MGIANDKIIKVFIEALTGLISSFNKITENMNGMGGSVVRVLAMFTGFKVVGSILEKIIKRFVQFKKGAEKISTIASIT
jgi:hypothetical protein